MKIRTSISLCEIYDGGEEDIFSTVLNKWCLKEVLEEDVCFASERNVARGVQNCTAGCPM